MKDSAQSTSAEPRGGCVRRIVAFVLVLIALFVTQTWLLVPGIVGCLLLGWVWIAINPSHPFGVWQSWPATTALTLLVIAAALSLLLTDRRAGGSDAAEPTNVRTPNRHLIRVGMVVWFFAAAVSGTGIVFHGSILMSDRFLEPYSWSRTSSKNNAKQFALAMHNYADAHHQFPVGGTYAADGQPHHSWPALLLPFIDQRDLADEINWNLPWNHPRNKLPMQTMIDGYTNPRLHRFQEDSRGYGAIHYAANSHLLGVNSGLRIRDITDDTSNTILGGEVASQFTAWGQPPSVRDPTLGINRTPAGFGSPFRQNEHGRKTGGCHFMLADGSVRWLSENVDPDVLRLLGLPQDGQSVPDY